MRKDAVISSDGLYRYSLSRMWGDGDHVVWVMLNPSTADADQDDPTIRRCIRFTKDWGYDGILVVNLFAYRVTSPKELAKVGDPVGPENRFFCMDAFGRATEESPYPALVIAAWGRGGRLRRQDEVMLGWMRDAHVVPECLTKGRPQANHPLYLPASLVPVPLVGAPGVTP